MDQTTNKIFNFNKLTVFFKHTDYYGELHPYNYCEWTSYVREEFLVQKCKKFKEMLRTSIRMMTAKIEAHIYAAALFGDLIEARLRATRIRKSSMDIIIQFFNEETDLLLAVTRHTLVFLDAKDRIFVPIPSELKSVAYEYLSADDI